MSDSPFQSFLWHLNPLNSPAGQTIAAHAMTAVAASAATNPSVILNLIPDPYKGVVAALLPFVAGVLAKHSFSTVLNTTPPAPVVNAPSA